MERKITRSNTPILLGVLGAACGIFSAVKAGAFLFPPFAMPISSEAQIQFNVWAIGGCLFSAVCALAYKRFPQLFAFGLLAGAASMMGPMLDNQPLGFVAWILLLVAGCWCFNEMPNVRPLGGLVRPNPDMDFQDKPLVAGHEAHH